MGASTHAMRFANSLVSGTLTGPSGSAEKISGIVLLDAIFHSPATDSRIQGIVDNWPVAVDGARAIAIGLPQPPPLKQIVEEYLGDFWKR